MIVLSAVPILVIIILFFVLVNTFIRLVSLSINGFNSKLAVAVAIWLGGIVILAANGIS